MSSYIYKKAIRYKLSNDEAKDYLDNGFFDNNIIKKIGLKDNFEFDIAYDFNKDEEVVYLDKVYEKQYDEVCEDFGKSRMLTDKEIVCHLQDFWIFNSNIKPNDLRAVEFCYYNGVDEPAYFDITKDEVEGWLF